MDEKLKESKQLQGEAKRLADVLWAGRDDDTARLLREGVKAMAERDYLLVKSTRTCPECGGLDSMLARCFRCGTTYGGKNMCKAAEPEPAVELKIRSPHGETTFEVPRDALGPDLSEQLREREAMLAEKARAATSAEEKALADFTGALEEVRGKLCLAVRVPEDTPWERLVPAVEAMNHLIAEVSDARDEVVVQRNEAANQLDRAIHERDEAQKVVQALQEQVEEAIGERNAQIIAMRVLADQITEADKVLRSIMGAPALGGDPQYASDFVEQARVVKTWVEDRSVAYGEQRKSWEDTEGKLRATIENLEDDLQDIRQGDAGQAFEWKQSFWTLAARLGVPREMMGQPKSPNVDGVMKYVDHAVLPLLQVEKRLEAVEKQLQEQEAEAHAPKSLIKGREVECLHCGSVYPDGVQFCPHCGKD